MRGIRAQLSRTQSRVKEINNQVIIVGANDIGIHLAETLARQNHNVILIDEKEEFLQELSEEVDVLPLSGNPLALETLKAAGAGVGTRLIAVTDSDEVNLLLLFLGESLGIADGFAVVKGQKQYESFLPKVSRSGGRLHLIYLWELVTGYVERRGHLQMRILHTDREKGIGLAAVEFHVKHPFLGKSMDQVKFGGRSKPLFLFKKGSALSIESHNRLEVHDILLLQIDLLEQERSLRNWFSFDLGHKLMVGGGDFLPTFLSHWPGFSRGLTCIEKDLIKCQQLLKVGKHALVFKGDELDIALLQEARIDEAKMFLAASENDEINLLSSLLARSYGVKEVLTLLQKRQHTGMLERLSLDGIIAIPQLVVDQLVTWLSPQRKNSVLSRLELQWTCNRYPDSAQLLYRGGGFSPWSEQRLVEEEEVLTVRPF